jgi:hypothetical protein
MRNYSCFAVTLSRSEQTGEAHLAPWFALFVSVWSELHARHWRSFEYSFGTRYGIKPDQGFLNMRDRPVRMALGVLSMY